MRIWHRHAQKGVLRAIICLRFICMFLFQVLYIPCARGDSLVCYRRPKGRDCDFSLHGWSLTRRIRSIPYIVTMAAVRSTYGYLWIDTTWCLSRGSDKSCRWGRWNYYEQNAHRLRSHFAINDLLRNRRGMNACGSI